MSKRIIKRGHWETITERSLGFYWKDDPHAGFGFDCDEDWNPILETEAARQNYENCLNGTYEVNGPTKETYTRRIWEPAEALCDCGVTIYLHNSLVNSCERCNREYNASGQLLARREQWGDDTGESVSDILRGNLPMGGDY